jgi:spore coat protein CotF
MTSLIGSIFSDTSNISADQTIAYNSSAGAAAAAQAYLTATLVATTPEVRRLFSEYCTQSLIGHEALIGLVVKKGWVNPYDSIDKQLQSALQQSQPVVNNQH